MPFLIIKNTFGICLSATQGSHFSKLAQILFVLYTMGQKCLVFEIHLVEKPTLNRSSLAFAKRGFALRARLASLGFARNYYFLFEIIV